MKLNFTFLLLFFIFFSQINAQQALQSSLYMLNPYDYNPAYAGLDNNSLSINGVFRKQWTGLEGSPSTQTLNAHLPIYYLGGAFGISLSNDVLGAERNLSGSLSYAYQRELGDKGILSLGVAGGIIQKSLDGEKLRAPGGIYEGNVIQHNDLNLPEGLVQGIAPLLSVGAYFQNEFFEFGLSANNLLESDVKYSLNNVTNIQLKRNYFFNFNAKFDLGTYFVVKPSILLKSDLVQTQTEVSILTTYNDNITGGVSFRGYDENTIDALGIIIGFQITSKLKLVYGYDVTLSGLNVVSRGSHEIMFNYNLNKIIGQGKPEKIIYNPRFL